MEYEGYNGITKDEIISRIPLIGSILEFNDSKGLVGISGKPSFLEEKNSKFLEGKIIFYNKGFEEDFLDFWTSENSYLNHIIKYVKDKNESMFFQLKKDGVNAQVFGGGFLDYYYLIVDEKNALTDRGLIERSMNLKY